MEDFTVIFLDCSTLVGGVLIILGFAMGFTGYLVDAQIPLKILNFVQSTISSKIIFLCNFLKISFFNKSGESENIFIPS